MKKKRKQYTPAEKVAILRRHLVEKEAVSKICDDVGIAPTMFYNWQRLFFENGAAAFEKGRRPAEERKNNQRVEKLEEKLKQKNEVLSELMEEHVKLKKDLGEL